MEPIEIPPLPDTKPYKAVITAVGGLIGTVVLALLDGNLDGGEIAAIITAVTVLTGLVYAVRNPPKEPPVG